MFNFERVGLIQYKPEVADADAMFEAALEAGASDVVSTDDGHDILTAPDELHAVKDALEKAFGEPEAARLECRITSYNVCYTKLLRSPSWFRPTARRAC